MAEATLRKISGLRMNYIGVSSTSRPHSFFHKRANIQYSLWSPLSFSPINQGGVCQRHGHSPNLCADTNVMKVKKTHKGGDSQARFCGWKSQREEFCIFQAFQPGDKVPAGHNLFLGSGGNFYSFEDYQTRFPRPY